MEKKNIERKKNRDDDNPNPRWFIKNENFDKCKRYKNVIGNKTLEQGKRTTGYPTKLVSSTSAYHSSVVELDPEYIPDPE